MRVPRISLLRVRSTRLTVRRSRALIDAAVGLAMAVATEHVPNRMGEAQTIVQELASAGTLIGFCTDERVTCAIRGLAKLAAHKVALAIHVAATANDDEAPAAAAATPPEAPEVCACATVFTDEPLLQPPKKELRARPPSHLKMFRTQDLMLDAFAQASISWRTSSSQRERLVAPFQRSTWLTKGMVRSL